VKICLGYLYSNVKHPDVVKRQFTVITAKDIELTLYNIGSVAASRSGSIVTGLDLFPHVLVNVEHVHIIHPVSTIVPAKIVNFRVDQAACS
jgi:hypothetical protein